MATYYVRPTNGSNANAGTSFALAWQTTQYALDNATAGDTVYLCAEATETTAVQIDADTNSGSNGSIISFEGRDGTDGSTAATYTLQASASITSLLDRSVTYLYWKDVVFDGNSNCTQCVNETTEGDETTYENCRFTGANSSGYVARSDNEKTLWVNCEFDTNGEDGFKPLTSNDGGGRFVGCKFHDNTGNGFYSRRANLQVFDCWAYDNGGDGFKIDARNGAAWVCNCSSLNNDGDGFDLQNVHELVVVDCISRRNGAYGFNMNSETDYQWMGYNCAHNNTSPAIDINGGTLPGPGNVTSDPKFQSETDGSEDLRLQSDSPCFQAGVAGTDMGAFGLYEAGGGGGGGGWGFRRRPRTVGG